MTFNDFAFGLFAGIGAAAGVAVLIGLVMYVLHWMFGWFADGNFGLPMRKK